MFSGMTTKGEKSYFQKLDNPADEILIRIKGNFRRSFLGNAIRSDGGDSVPPAWQRHDLSHSLRDFLQARHPRARGGEDLEDLAEGEVEIARLTLADSVHGEVVSLRAKKIGGSKGFSIRMVDEYQTEIHLPYAKSSRILTDEEILELFLECDPCQLSNALLAYDFQSFFHPSLNEIAKERGVSVSPVEF
jgi:hypothetical protein